jgi:hypothetical protein
VFKKFGFMKRRSFFTVVAAIAAGLLILGLAGLSWIFGQSPLGLLKGATQANPQALIFIPKQAPAMGSLLVNPDRLEQLQLALVQPDRRKAQRETFDNLRDGLLGSELSYQRDVQPWLGNEVTLAVTSLDLDRDAANGAQPGYLMALVTQDAARSREFLQLFWQKRAIGQDLAFEQYQGTQIIYGQASNPNPDAAPIALASAVVGNRFVLFANSPKVLRDAINNVQAVELNLGNNPDYQRAIAALPNNRVGLSYLNLPELAALNGDRQVLEQSLDLNGDPKTYRQMAIGLGIDRQGLVANTAVIGGTAQTSQLGDPTALLRYFSGTTQVALSGTNLASTWPTLTQGLQNYKLSDRLIKQSVDRWGQQWHLDFAQDLFPWVTGNYALGYLPAAVPTTEAKAQPTAQTTEWLFVVDRATNPNYTQGIERLNAIAKTQNITPATIPVGNQTVTAWTELAPVQTDPKNRERLSAKTVGAWAEVDQAIIFASSIETLKQAIQPTQGLTQNSGFKQTIAPLGDNNNGYLYLDWPSVKPTIQAQAPIVRLLDLVAQPLMQNLKSLGLSGYGGEGDMHRGRVFLRLR